ncbi:MAG: carboxypeptidase-like regulatory domain-containing protein, partial [Myxococcota bacterium]|nr:carboxypeptidase-like regulatory domain-containing protein [Myxococcota bacterium]
MSLLGGQVDLGSVGIVARLLRERESDPETAIQTTELRPDGAILFNDVEAGRWWVRVSAEGFYPQLREVLVPVGAEVNVGHFDLQRPPVDAQPIDAILRGLATRSDTESHEGILIEVLQADQLVASTVTEENGTYALRLPLSRYTLRASAPFYESASIVVEWDPEDVRFEV